MKRFTQIFLLLLCSAILQAACKPDTESPPRPIVHPSVVAGKFYPADPVELRGMVVDLLNSAKSEPKNEKLLGIVAPHAGYLFSGSVAAEGFKLLKDKTYDTIVILAPSHHTAIDGASILDTDAYATPLGKVTIDKESAQKLIGRFPWIAGDKWTFAKEHAMEVELPFLQVAIKNIKILPIIIGTHNVEKLDTLAALLSEVFADKNVLYISSTDLSHYHPYKDAINLDRETIALIQEGNTLKFAQSVAAGRSELCGFPTVYIMMELLKMNGGGNIDILKYANSGDMSGEKSKVVGYTAAAFYEQFSLSDAQKMELLDIAKTSVLNAVTKKPQPELAIKDPYLKQNGAAFVTLKKNGILRGCMGQINAAGALASTVREMSISAALSDPRFPPVTPAELKDITYEISVLSPPQRVFDTNVIKIGRDGLIIRNGNNRGVLLPRVPVEEGWSLEQYLREICHKAGLTPDTLGNKDTELFRFQAIVF